MRARAQAAAARAAAAGRGREGRELPLRVEREGPGEEQRARVRRERVDGDGGEPRVPAAEVRHGEGVGLVAVGLSNAVVQGPVDHLEVLDLVVPSVAQALVVLALQLKDMGRWDVGGGGAAAVARALLRAAAAQQEQRARGAERSAGEQCRPRSEHGHAVICDLQKAFQRAGTGGRVLR